MTAQSLQPNLIEFHGVVREVQEGPNHYWCVNLSAYDFEIRHRELELAIGMAYKVACQLGYRRVTFGPQQEAT